jgi:integrase
LKLTETKVKNAKTNEGRQLKLADGGGLYLLVTPTAKLWRWKYRFNRKEKSMSFGPYPEVTLARARDLHLDARRILRTGIDPMAERRADKIEIQRSQATSFEVVALQWHDWWASDKNPEYAEDVKIRLTRDIFPVIGHLPIDKIIAAQIVAAVKKIENRGAREVAVRTLGNVGQVFRYAVAHQLADRNPAADLKAKDIFKPAPVVNMARVEAEELPTLLRKMEYYEGSVVTRLAMKIMALTFVRTSELIEAEWTEFDFKKKMWTIPAARMKQVQGVVRTTPHKIPLAKQTIDALASLHEITGDGKLLFPHQWNKKKTMSKNTILEALYRMGYKGEMTGHGFRGVASTILHETRAIHGFEHEHIDLQLAHVKRNDVSAAYDYSKYLPERTKMMQWWADYLDETRRSAKVLPFKGTAA